MVNLKNCSIEKLYNICKKRRMFLFGLSKTLDSQIVYRTPDYDVREVADGIIDNDINKHGNIIETTSGKQLKIYSLEKMKNGIRPTDIVLITSIHYCELIEQLDAERSFDQIDCYILYFVNDCMDAFTDVNVLRKADHKSYIIPPIIHFCWFGQKQIPEKYLEYMSTWKKYCPNYEIVKWDETNFDVNQHPYTKWAYENEKWPFISDYARLNVLFNHGGIYLDTDVELIKSLDDLRRYRAFIGYESFQMVATGLGIGACKGNSIIKEMLDDYDNVDINHISDYPCTVYQSNYLEKRGLRRNNTFQILDDGECVVLPSDYLCGIRLYTRVRQITEHTVSLHHYLGNWAGEQQYTEKEIYDKNLMLWKRIEENIIE